MRRLHLIPAAAAVVVLGQLATHPARAVRRIPAEFEAQEEARNAITKAGGVLQLASGVLGLLVANDHRRASRRCRLL